MIRSYLLPPFRKRTPIQKGKSPLPSWHSIPHGKHVMCISSGSAPTVLCPTRRNSSKSDWVDPKKMTVQRDLFKLKLGRVALITNNPDRIRGLPELLATYGGESSILSVAELSKLSLIHPEVVIVCTDKGTRWMRPDDGQDQGEVLNAFGNYKVVGMGYGAARLFSLWSLDISADKCGPHGESDRPLTVELAEALKYPEAIPNPVQVAAKGSDALGAFGDCEFYTTKFRADLRALRGLQMIGTIGRSPGRETSSCGGSRPRWIR